MDEELKARIYALPTREELERIFANLVTKEVFQIELNRIREDQIKPLKEEIDALKKQPDIRLNRTIGMVTIASLTINAVAIILAHFIWR